MARILVAVTAAALVIFQGAAPSTAQTTAYITNEGQSSVSVIATASNTAIGMITVGSSPAGVAVTPNGDQVYVANSGSSSVSVIATATDTVVGTITVGGGPFGVAVTPDGGTVYVANNESASVSVIATATNTVTGTITVGRSPTGVAVTPDGSTVYVANQVDGTVSVIDAASGTVTGTITVGSSPEGVAVTPDGSTVYVANFGSNTVSVIATANNTVTASVPVGSMPYGVAVTPDGATVYVANEFSNDVSVIATANNTVTATVPVGTQPIGVAITPDGGSVYVANLVTNTVSVIATASETVTATIPVGFNPFAFGNFIGSASTVTLTVSESGSGSGTVVSNPSGIDCPGVCNGNFQTGSQVVLTAAAANGSVFSGWNGAGCSGTGTCTVTMNAAQGVSATFAASGSTATLTVAEIGTGAGQVTSSPAGIDCSVSSNQCTASFAVGTPITLTASASSGSSFTGWSGGGCGGTGACQITLSADTGVTASFTLGQTTTNMLSIAENGGGSGKVTSKPSGIDCGSTCAASFVTGTQIVLSAVADNGSTFVGWSGGGCEGIESCTLTLDADTTVTASFVANSASNLTLVAAVLPLSRSVEIGHPATVFATVIDAGPADASTCTIAPQTGVPADFLFQTTDPTTNALTGAVDTPANIAAGQSQSFVIALTPTAAFAPTNVAFTFTCANAANPAPVTLGVDTLNLSGSASPVPDIVALVASADPGYVDIPSVPGTGVFAVATINLGSAAAIAAAANTGAANVPVTLLVCQTDPTSGTCLAPPSFTVTTDIQPNATPTFAVFVTSTAPVADMPAVNRVFVIFADGGGALRGETSVAVRTR